MFVDFNLFASVKFFSFPSISFAWKELCCSRLPSKSISLRLYFGCRKAFFLILMKFRH